MDGIQLMYATGETHIGIFGFKLDLAIYNPLDLENAKVSLGTGYFKNRTVG